MGIMEVKQKIILFYSVIQARVDFWFVVYAIGFLFLVVHFSFGWMNDKMARDEGIYLDKVLWVCDFSFRLKCL